MYLDQSGKEFSSNKNNKTSLTQSKLPQLSTSLMKSNGEETFASETISSSALPNYAPEMLKEENEKEQQMTAAPGLNAVFLIFKAFMKIFRILGPLDICTGGSTCVEGICLCPAGTRPSVKSENCETFEQRKSSIQQEQNKKEYSKYANKIPRMQSGPIGRPYARPSESCANREICTGGSVCQNSNKICECPPNKSILRNHICIQSDEPPMLRVVHAFPGDKCNSETNCERESVCVEGTCRCQNNDFTPKSGNCTKRSVIETPASVQSPSTFEAINSDYDNILPPVQLPEEGSSLEVQHPRISGPPLKKHSSSSSSLISNILPQLTKNEPPIKGVCPPGNSPTISRSTGQIIKCNGMTPNCPPKSYCFVTGDASETYNCCKSY
uniref:Uncharacterized protein n=1 Tax=Meloidogyne enterolobii TaxID=390850 RepID=A0A6V7UBU3_MELEN|nr:unnamed protein product [Meloidogyne enterolobii]